MSLFSLQIQQELEQIDRLMINTEEKCSLLLNRVHPAQKVSAVNLLHYLSLRSMDIRELQHSLHNSGLSSLTNSEGYIRSQLLAVLNHLKTHNEQAACTPAVSQEILQKRNGQLFGKSPTGLIPSIMVTFKTNYGFDHTAVRKLLKSGMQIARINCAHDNEKTWLSMISIVRRASEKYNLPCKIYMDLAGPKIRTHIDNKKNRISLDVEDRFLLSEITGLKSKLPVIGCTAAGITSQLHPGERIFFDDGLIETRVISRKPGAAELEVIRVATKKPFLKNEKGMNFPDSHLQLTALTDYDRKCLPFILDHADMVGYSFVHNTPDLDLLRIAMKKRKLPVILKIETPEAFTNLPELLFSAMEDECFGVMIARGDLAVEVGFEKMREVQDEISWMCEAAHVPLIQATQFLENMNKKGIATRAEITDASYGFRADCVLINKGSHMAQVVTAFKNILERMSAYHFKKRYLYRPLDKAGEFLQRSSST